MQCYSERKPAGGSDYAVSLYPPLRVLSDAGCDEAGTGRADYEVEIDQQAAEAELEALLKISSELRETR